MSIYRYTEQEPAFSSDGYRGHIHRTLERCFGVLQSPLAPPPNFVPRYHPGFGQSPGCHFVGDPSIVKPTSEVHLVLLLVRFGPPLHFGPCQKQTLRPTSGKCFLSHP